jgi:hypothetical protein
LEATTAKAAIKIAVKSQSKGPQSYAYAAARFNVITLPGDMGVIALEATGENNIDKTKIAVHFISDLR